MSNVYFLDSHRQKVGPIPPEELAQRGATPESLVWMPGLANWTPAKDVQQLAAFLPATPQPAPAPQPAAPVQPAAPAPAAQPAPAPQPVAPIQPAAPAPAAQPAPAPQPATPVKPVASAPAVQPAPAPQAAAPVFATSTAEEEYYEEEAPKTNVCGAIGMVVALMLLFAWIPGVSFFLTWLIALIFSIIGVCRKPKGMALTGLIICIVIFLIGLIVLIVGGSMMRSLTRGF